MSLGGNRAPCYVRYKAKYRESRHLASVTSVAHTGFVYKGWALEKHEKESVDPSPFACLAFGSTVQTASYSPPPGDSSHSTVTAVSRGWWWVR